MENNCSFGYCFESCESRWINANNNVNRFICVCSNIKCIAKINIAILDILNLKNILE